MAQPHPELNLHGKRGRKSRSGLAELIGNMGMSDAEVKAFAEKLAAAIDAEKAKAEAAKK